MVGRNSGLALFSLSVMVGLLSWPVQAKPKARVIVSNGEFNVIKEGGRCDENFVKRTAPRLERLFRKSRGHFGFGASGLGSYTVHLVSDERFRAIFAKAQEKSYMARALPIKSQKGFVAIAFDSNFYLPALTCLDDWAKVWGLQVRDLHRRQTGQEMKDYQLTVATQNIQDGLKVISVSELQTSGKK